LRRNRQSRVCAAAVILSVAASARAQPPSVPEQPLLGSTFAAGVLRDLPTGNNVFAVAETIQLEAISDLFTAGGLNVARAPKAGALLNSWTQTQYRIGDVSITDPRAGGTPLMLPFLPLWDRVTVATGAMGLDDSAPGLSISLEPPRPGATWLRSAEGSFSGSALVSRVSGAVPAVDRVDQWQDANVMVSGPVTGRVGLAAAGSWRNLSHVAAPGAASIDRVASGFAHVVFAATPRDDIRALGWLQRGSTAALTDTAVHVQATWERRDPVRLSWRVFGGYTGRDRTTPLTTTLIVDSLESDAVSDLVDTGAGAARRWIAGARVAPGRTRRLPSFIPFFIPSFGVDVDGAEVRLAPNAIARINELVNGVPARAWMYRNSGSTDVRGLTTFAAFADEHVASGRLTLDLGIRFESVHGDANGAERGISWTTWLPRAMVRLHLFDTANVAGAAGYRRTAYQPPLNVLAVGDPAAPVADIARWNGTSIGPLVARVGPGTGGDAAFAQIDPKLRRPTTDELVLALQSRPTTGIQLELARVTKREQPLLGFVDTGVTASEYSSFQVPDPSFLPGNLQGAPFVAVLNRPAGAYGRDRYLLTNQTGEAAKSWALEATVRANTDRLMLLFGLGLTWAKGPAAAVGFLPTQNDQNVLGNLLVDANSATEVRGQLFQDRSHIGKIAGIYRFPARFTLGAILRYADGQPFARLVVVPDLTQGPTAVRSYANGGTAFTYVGTLDIRVQKAFTAGRADVTALLDLYNLPNKGNEVTEYVVSGPMFRTPTALQPPRTAVAGLRVSF
jgi:hypothetical protein